MATSDENRRPQGALPLLAEVRIGSKASGRPAAGGQPLSAFTQDRPYSSTPAGSEGIVSKRRDAPYQHGRSRTWLKTKNPASPGDDAGVGGPVLMTAPLGAQFEIKVDGVVRSNRDRRDTAIEAARFLQQRNPGAKITVTDLRDGSVVSFDRSA